MGDRAPARLNEPDATPDAEPVAPAAAGVAAGAAAWTAVGPQDAPAIVFIHGTRLSRAQWTPVVRRLGRRYRCVTLDLPGHGARRAEAFTFEAAAAAVDEAIAGAVPTGQALVVGLSLGGYVAIEVAEQHPDRVQGLVLAGCSAEPERVAGAVMRALAVAFERVPRGVLDTVNTAVFRVRYPPAVAGPVIAGGYWYAAGVAALRGLVRRRYLDRLSRLWTPVLVVNGTFDPLFGPGGQAWAASARRGRSAVVRWAGHLAPMDRPVTFAALVDTFARELVETP